jgi:hypothetical protein
MRHALAIALVAAGCSGTTGSNLVTFTARAGGPADATGAPLELDSGMGYHVSLRTASFHLGAVYLNQAVPSSGGLDEPCILPGIYVGQALGSCDDGVCGLDLDLLSPTLVPFGLPGEGTANPAVEADVWLTSGDINATTDSKPVLVTSGVAAKGDQLWPFRATLTIGANRKLPPSTPSMPGANPICRQRIVSPICVNPDPKGGCPTERAYTLSNGGTLDVRVDPRDMFANVDFASLTPEADGTYVIPDTQGGVGGAFFKGVKSTAPYHFSYSAAQ